MTRWQRGEADIERMLAGGELQALTGAAADGEQWLAKARRTLSTAAGAVRADPDSAFTLAYDADQCRRWRMPRTGLAPVYSPV